MLKLTEPVPERAHPRSSVCVCNVGFKCPGPHISVWGRDGGEDEETRADHRASAVIFTDTHHI